MRKANELIGKRIIHQVSGEKLGSVQDLIFDTNARHLIGLMIDSGGLFGDATIMRWSSVATVGDVIVAQGDAPVGKLKDDSEIADLLKNKSTIASTTIISDQGERIGTLGDLFISDGGEVVGYEVSRGFINDLGGRKFLPAEHVKTVGKDVIIANESDLRSVREVERQQEAGAEASHEPEAGREQQASQES